MGPLNHNNNLNISLPPKCAACAQLFFLKTKLFCFSSPFLFPLLCQVFIGCVDQTNLARVFRAHA